MGFKMKFGGFGNECATCGVASCVCGESPAKLCSPEHWRDAALWIGRGIGKGAKAVINTGKKINKNIKTNKETNKRIRKNKEYLKKGSKTSHSNPRTLKSTNEKNYGRFGDQ